jgi:hypothetical protein
LKSKAEDKQSSFFVNLDIKYSLLRLLITDTPLNGRLLTGAIYGTCYNIIVVQQNSYPLRDWHFEHMQKTIVKYVFGLSDDASPYNKKQHKKYGGNLAYVRRNIDFDIRHGVTKEEVTEFLNKIQNDPSFADQRKIEGSKGRFEELRLEKQ